MTKRVSDSMVEIAHIVRPTDLNSAKRLFGGTLMSWIDEAAVIVAKRHSNMNVTTASVDNLSFLSAARMRDVIVIIATCADGFLPFYLCIFNKPFDSGDYSWICRFLWR